MVLGPLAAAGEADDDATLNKVVEFNKKALLAYHNLEVATAADLLQQALALCTGNDLASRAAAARTHVHLGVVYVSGLKKRQLGVAELERALAIDPTIKIEKSLLNPEVQLAFADAKAVAVPAQAAKGKGAAPASPPAPAGVLGPLANINHLPVTRALRGRPVLVQAQVPPGLAAAKVVLAYQAEDADLFLAREMAPRKDAPGWYEAEIPSAATQGTQVAYYVEAQNPDEQPIGGHGSPEHPHRIALLSESTPAPPPAPPKAPTPGVWIALALGSGAGYHSGTPEMNRVDMQQPPQAIHVSGFGLASAAHLAPEIGFFARDNLLVSVQGRLQLVTGAQDVVIGAATYHPARLALAELAKVSWFFGSGSQTWRTFLSAQAGVGQIRHDVTTPTNVPLAGCGQGCKDTVRGGPGLTGLGAGLAYRLGPGLVAFAAVEALAGIPDFMVNADLNLGIAIMQ